VVRIRRVERVMGGEGTEETERVERVEWKAGMWTARIEDGNDILIVSV